MSSLFKKQQQEVAKYEADNKRLAQESALLDS